MSKSTKFLSRLYAFHFLYKSSNLSNIDAENLSEQIMDFELTLHSILEEDPNTKNLNVDSKEFGKVIIDQFISHLEEINIEIHKFIHRNNFENLTATEKTILKLGYYELKFTRNAYNEIINDYVELAKSYGTKDSYSMINGVLDSVRKSI